jgi:hypothetical protein
MGHLGYLVCFLYTCSSLAAPRTPSPLVNGFLSRIWRTLAALATPTSLDGGCVHSHRPTSFVQDCQAYTSRRKLFSAPAMQESQFTDSYRPLLSYTFWGGRFTRLLPIISGGPTPALFLAHSKTKAHARERGQRGPART